MHLAGSLAALVLVPVLIAHIDRGPLLKALSDVSLVEIAIGLLIVQAQIILSALRWRFTAQRLGQDMPLGWAVREYYIATALNQTLPGGVAGDALRAYRSRTSAPSGIRLAAKSVIIERLSGQMAFFVVCACGLFFWPGLLASVFPVGLLPVALLSAAALIVILVLAWKKLAPLRDDLAQVFVRDGAWKRQAGLSLSAVGSYILLFWFAAHATGGTLPLSGLVTVVPLCLLSMLIPTGFGGWGTREAAAAALWPLIGLASAQGVAASVTYGALALIGALPGLLLLLVSHRTAAKEAHRESRA
ncbi:lysylphosphatidylglycerol synthase transmembrane domain-containing protein [Affinirhizobium pseudoryzae]|uniref:lysylphosphatidylglycerol synthase transmembrane domain-containing protein n=1 Tax=Allorhizobium pseudoryzae TaxID=379684 RepID=UPI0013EB6515|nr:lysylphosphatidylglycerol synthase transmembrane domain-containing protein [Allorhizobium pseudoryzae]